MTLYFIANARMPTEKAHGIQIAKMCEAFIEAGVKVQLIVPRRGNTQSLREYYNLRVDVPVVRLPALGRLYRRGRTLFALSSALFMLGYFLYLLWKQLRGEQFVTYSVDMDTFSFFPMALLRRRAYIEMHTPKPSTALTRFVLKHAAVIATNTLIADEFGRTFGMRRGHMTVEPNGVDESLLATPLSKQEARQKLGFPKEVSFALYAGRFYDWKELGILSDAAAGLAFPIAVVGGTRDEFERVTKTPGKQLQFFGSRPAQEVPLWLAAADVLLVLGTAKNEASYRYTAPMKIYEYFAARRPVVASATPALRSLIPQDAALWYEPDNARSLNDAISSAMRETATIERGVLEARAHTWRARAGRILNFIHA